MSSSIQPTTRLHPTETILVQGAGGVVGYAILSALLSPRLPHMKSFNLRAGIRDLSKLDKVMSLSPRLEVVQLDTQFPQSVHIALQGVSKLVVCPPSTEDRVEATKLLIQAAMERSVSHITLISVDGADRCATATQKQFHCIEQFLERSGVCFTILRCALFMEEFLWFASLLMKGKLPLPLHSGSSPMVALRDVGECAATILTSHELVHYQKWYNLTGPEVLDGPAMASRLSEGLGTPITFVELTDIEAYNTFLAFGCTHAQASVLVAAFGMLALGGPDIVHHDTRSLLGCAGTPLAIWARDNYFTFVELSQRVQGKAKVAVAQPHGVMNKATNEQGQSTTNQQGQQGSVSLWEEYPSLVFE